MVHPPTTSSGGVKVMTMGVGGGSAASASLGVAHDSITQQRRYEQASKLASFLDPHMLFYILTWLREKQVYSAEDVDSARFTVLSHTSLLSAIAEVTTDSGLSPSFDLDAKRHSALNSHSEMEKAIRPFVMCIQKVWKDKDNMLERRSMQDLSDWWVQQKASTVTALTEEGKSAAQIHEGPELHVPFAANAGQKVLLMCKSFYESGDYSNARRWLSWCENRVCEVTTDGFDFDANKTAQWGLLCALIMLYHASNPHVVFERAEGEVSEEDERSTHITEAADRIIKIDELLDHASKLVQHVAPTTTTGEAVTGTDAPGHSAAPPPAEATIMKLYSYEDILIQRAWLIHAALWPLFRYYLPKAAVSGGSPATRPSLFPDLIEWFLQERNLSLVRLACPHLLRYYAVWAIVNRNRTDHFKTLLDMISAIYAPVMGIGATVGSGDKSSDPFSALLVATLVMFDFDEAKEKLAECSDAAEVDFFLNPLKGTIEEHSRLLIFETYCRIHKSINIDMIATQLNMPSETAERWIVNLIRHARLEAKIDSERNRVEISNQTQSVYQEVMERSRSVMLRSQHIIQSIERLPGGVMESKGRDRDRD